MATFIRLSEETRAALTQFGASLRFVELPAVAEFLGSVAATGRLRMVSGEWVGEIVLRRGQMVATSLGDERGIGALESMAVGFLDGEFNFADGPVAEDEPALVALEQTQDYLRHLNAERREIMEVIESLSLIPRLNLEGGEHGRGGDVTIDASALQTIPLLVSCDTIDALARRRGLARTVRDVAALARAGVVRLERGVEESPPESQNPPARVVPARIMAARRPQSRTNTTTTSVRPTHTRPTRVSPRPRPRTDTLDLPNPRLAADAIDAPTPRPKTAATELTRAHPPAVAIEPPRLYAQSALTAPYVRRTLAEAEADAPRRAVLAGWSDALARILRRPQQMHGRPPLFEPRYTYIRTQDPTLPG